MAGSGGKGGSGKGARSLGAAAGMGGKPSGAILDDTAEVLLQQKQRFKAWAKGYRQKSLKPNPQLEMLYDKSPTPKGGS